MLVCTDCHIVSSSYQIKQFVFIAVADLWAHGRTDRHSCCTSQAQYPLSVGVVVVAVATGLEKGVWTTGAWTLQSLTSSSGSFEKVHL